MFLKKLILSAVVILGLGASVANAQVEGGGGGGEGDPYPVATGGAFIGFTVLDVYGTLYAEAGWQIASDGNCYTDAARGFNVVYFTDLVSSSSSAGLHPYQFNGVCYVYWTVARPSGPGTNVGYIKMSAASGNSIYGYVDYYAGYSY